MPKDMLPNKLVISTTIVLVFFLAICSVLYAQRANSSGAFIEIVDGVKLRLGMSKSEVAEKLVGTPITKTDEDNWVIGTIFRPSMQFTSGHLSFADRPWNTTNGDNIAETLFGVVSSLNSEGYSICEVTTSTKVSPHAHGQYVWIDCGEKTILVMSGSVDNGRHNQWVVEQLGHSREH